MFGKVSKVYENGKGTITGKNGCRYKFDIEHLCAFVDVPQKNVCRIFGM